MNKLQYICAAVLFFSVCFAQEEIVYAEMEFPLSFVEQIRQYTFNPLARFQTQVEGRLIELTTDPLVDIYQVTSGQQAYRSCLATFRTVKLRDREVLSFNLQNALFQDGKKLSFDDVLFSLEYKKLNPDSWKANNSLVITTQGSNSFNAFYGNSLGTAPLPGEFYFPIVDKRSYLNSQTPSKSRVSKRKQKNIGYGRYKIDSIEENRFIKMKRTAKHPYFSNLQYPNNHRPVEYITMFSFPNARITRNEQFINGNVHLITESLQTDVSYIQNTLGKKNVKTLRYSDDSFSGFVLNCEHPYLVPAAVRRAFNYMIRKRLMLKKALAGEGEIIAAPLPRRNFFYNAKIRPYTDDTEIGLNLLKLYRYWGLDVYKSDNNVIVYSASGERVKEFESGDIIKEIERVPVSSIAELLKQLEQRKDEEIVRIKVTNGNRVFVRRLQNKLNVDVGIWKSVNITGNTLSGFPKLSLIANNPQGKNQLVKQICGALKEDFAKFGVEVTIDYLVPDSYYPRLQKGDFDIAFRTVKLTGTPNLTRLFQHKKNQKNIKNVNYGRYHNATINKIANSTRDVTDVKILQQAWRKAFLILHHDPPYIFLWSRNHIIMHDPKLKILSPGPEYKVPHGYTQINGLINIFNEVHLWSVSDR
ncbi:ABC transporter substrate-binding protein [Candidatus Uabimicrobium sp. HlEnr_7]|uniref:ABC transporter substrate-binding protein n=1 Tax=Candidatus Uabimicrobium helgolandensis TaxID=3095367 RepID=UPI0035588848